MRPDSRTGIMLSSEERREVLVRIGRGEGSYPRRSGGNAGRGSRAAQIRLQMRRQQFVLFCGPNSEGWGCYGRPDRMPQYVVATTMATPEMLPV